ncbi:hypothetical protein AB0O07_12525 [Streptomyces sp. NPDC093085]|uniref:hypothetical protein n=1 Tax=Streptomyces sp. NPDC093085 TaxID=3155068 RepID=UPI00342EE5B7
MSTSDEAAPASRPQSAAEPDMDPPRADAGGDAHADADADSGSGSGIDSDVDAGGRGRGGGGGLEPEGEGGSDGDAEERTELTPRQARLVRIAAASALLVTLASFLAIRLAERTSVLVVGVYGVAMVLCGVVIELSRHGRTRMGTWLLAGCLVSAGLADWLLLP